MNKNTKRIVLILLAIIILLPNLLIIGVSAVYRQNFYQDIYYHFLNPQVKVTINAEVFIDGVPVAIDEKSVTVTMDYELNETGLSSITADNNNLTIKYRAPYGTFEYAFLAGDYKIVLNLPHFNEWEVNEYNYVISIDTNKQQITYDYKYSYPTEETYETIIKTGKQIESLQKENTISQYH